MYKKIPRAENENSVSELFVSIRRFAEFSYLALFQYCARLNGPIYPFTTNVLGSFLSR